MKTSTILNVGAIAIIGVGLLGIMLRKPPVPPPTLPTNYISPSEVGQFPSQAEEPIYSQPPASQTVSSRDMPSSIQPSVDNKGGDPIPIISSTIPPSNVSTSPPAVSPYLLSSSQGSTETTDSSISLPPVLPPTTAPTSNLGTVCDISNTTGVIEYEKRTGTELVKNSDLMNMTMNDFASWLTGKKTEAGCFPTVR
jgi:hypothetical protein